MSHSSELLNLSVGSWQSSALVASWRTLKLQLYLKCWELCLNLWSLHKIRTVSTRTALYYIIGVKVELYLGDLQLKKKISALWEKKNECARSEL